MFSLSQYAQNVLYSYGYFGLFAILMIEGMGLPVPVQLLFMATAYLIHRNSMSLTLVIVVSTFGNVCGNIIAYYLGYFGGRPFFDKNNKFLHVRMKT